MCDNATHHSVNNDPAIGAVPRSDLEATSWASGAAGSATYSHRQAESRAAA